jgi:uncharacterized protein DUF6325
VQWLRQGLDAAPTTTHPTRGGPVADLDTTKLHATDAELTEMGPIDYVVLEWPREGTAPNVAPMIVELVDRGIIRILDLVFIRKLTDGSVTAVALTDLDVEGRLYLAVFEGATSGLVDPADIEEAGRILDPGTTAAVLVYENLWAAPLAVELRRGGGHLVASGRIPVQSLLAALDAADAAEAAGANGSR